MSDDKKHSCQSCMYWRPHTETNEFGKCCNVNTPHDNTNFVYLCSNYKSGELVKTTTELVEERGNDYGDYNRNLTNIGTRWSHYLNMRYGVGVAIKPEDVAFMMAELKMERQCFKHKQDNIDDAMGYLEIHNKILLRE